MNENLAHIFFQITVYGITAVIVLMNKDSNPIVACLTSIAFLVSLFVGIKEVIWSIRKLREMKDE